MLDQFFIFGAKYLYIISLLIAALIFFKNSWSQKKEMIIFGLISFALAFLISLLARELYFNPRPFVIGGFTPLIPHEPDNGFPSDHTILASAIASLFLFYHKKTATWLWLIAIVVALSRVYVGVHHPIDVLGSIVVALLSALVAYAIIHKLWNKNKTNFLSH